MTVSWKVAGSTALKWMKDDYCNYLGATILWLVNPVELARRVEKADRGDVKDVELHVLTQ